MDRSTAASPMNNSPLGVELRDLLSSLKRASSNTFDLHSAESLQFQCDDLRRVRQLLIESGASVQIKDVFRHSHGFNILLDTFRSVSGFYNPTKLSRDEKIEFFELLKATLDVLSEAVHEHPGNRRFFTKRVEGGGWRALEQAIASTGLGASNSTESPVARLGQEQLFGCLFSFALGEETMNSTFRDIEKVASQTKPGLKERKCGKTESDIEDGTSEVLLRLRPHLKSLFSGTEVLRNPDIIPIIFSFWTVLISETGSATNSEALAIAVLLGLQSIIELSTYNKIAVHTSGILSGILKHFLGPNKSSGIHTLLKEIAYSLGEIGLNDLNDAYFLYREASHSDKAGEFLLDSMRQSSMPPFIQFDLSLHGFSSLELPSLGGQFPPGSSSAGYTLTAWIRVDQYDKNCHTTIFGVCDPSQTCFVLAYLEKESQHFILQTSITSSRPSVRFRTTVFKEGIWYHIAVVHRRPKNMSSSRASLYVNGEFAEQVKCQYPASPPISNGSTESFASLSSSVSKPAPVQAFLGTPQDLATRLGRKVVSSRWSLASFHLFQDALSDELLAVHQKLGPRYSGNFQDCLGSFQTYRASAELNLRNEVLHPGREEKSEIVSAIRLKASLLLPESRVLLSISPSSVLDDDDRNNVDESQLIKSLSKDAARSLQHLIRIKGSAVVINSAIPSINEALTHPHGVGILTGEPIVVVPQPLDDASWRVAGCAAIGLKMVELAQSKEKLLRAVNILFESIQGSWRNSESMEKENGFAVLAALLREKLGYGTLSGNGPSKTESALISPVERDSLALDLLKAILTFVGYDFEHPEESIIINPLAYRVLLVDFDMWRRTSLESQKLYYSQFICFSKESKNHHFNSKRLSRMRIVKRLLDALKGEAFTKEIMPHFLKAFRSLVQCSMSGDIHRAISLFITSALHDSRANSGRILRSKSSAIHLRPKDGTPSVTPMLLTPRSGSPNPTIGFNELSRAELGIRVLDMYTELLCERDSNNDIKKFARNITNKWLLYLLAEREPRVIVLGLKILSRLLIVHGSTYVKKFADKTGGFEILRYRLKPWWNTPAVWTICFAIFLGVDVAQIDFERDFDLFNLTDTFFHKNLQVAYPEILPVISAMLETGLQAIVLDAETPGTPTKPGREGSKMKRADAALKTHLRHRSMSLNSERESSRSAQHSNERVMDSGAVLQTVIQFLTDLHMRSQKFRDFASTSNYVESLLFVLYPVIVTSDHVSAETELHSRGSALTFEGEDVVIKSHSSSNDAHLIVRTTAVDPPPSPSTQRYLSLRRGSSFILVTSDKLQNRSSSARLDPILSPQKTAPVALKVGNAIVEALLEAVVAVFMDQVFQRKDFQSFGLYLKVPPGFQEHQAYFGSYVLRHTMSAISNSIQFEQKLVCEPRVLTNLARYCSHMAEAVFEGWFLNGAEPLLDFIGNLLDFLQRPDIAKIKSVRLCAQPISSIRTVFMRVSLLLLSELDEAETDAESIQILEKLTYWQTVILSPENMDGYYLRLICYLVYTKMIKSPLNVRLSAANFWRMCLVHKPEESALILTQSSTYDQKLLNAGFMKLVELDNEAFLEWVDTHRGELDTNFFGAISKVWEEFVIEENRRTEDTARTRVTKRKEKLKQWQTTEANTDNIWHRHELSTNHWRANIYASERLKYQRSLQDQQDNLSFVSSMLEKLDQILKGPCKLFEDEETPSKSHLDETEGRNRVRLRILPDKKPRQDDFQPKRKESGFVPKSKLKVDTAVPQITQSMGMSPTTAKGPSDVLVDRTRPRSTSDALGDPVAEDDFEMVDDPKEDDDGFEDKNRKVMRSLQRGDQVQHVCNVSRIIGLEACEGLLILGKDSLYLLDDFFQRSDGEIVRVAQAPTEERDAYLQMISGRETSTKKAQSRSDEQSTRHWQWIEVISISKRRFLFRDVAIEIFFADGRSYLLTAISPQLRNDLYSKLMVRAPHVNNPSSLMLSEDAWRIESLRNPDDVPQTIGSRFTSVFNSTASNPATRRWVKGEISNFHYLMLVNTLAGRTFNDLTQYPVFPWVVADYTSEELDLTNPRTFRDFSKPMGCQTAAREAEFRDRYVSFGEMGDHNAPAFHYGTHYSSAMIVSSYLIRLQPFVQSYLLLQGGSFDHADRLFSSIERAWLSASRDNMTDVRELTPEFFYLPEFLINSNGYNFGFKQGTGEKIDDVTLPPWAKGDPHIFIAKHREALESPYVSKHLHQWIDLVFGFKQRGDTAIDAVNVFHHLSYHGAKDLDTIEDPVERLATIGIIHNFGQTPHQVFQKSHVRREEASQRYKRLDNASESLARLPFPLLESHERVSSLLYSPKYDRLLCSAAFRINIPPNYERYMEWGFADGSVRFYAADSKKLIGLFEHIHQGQISCATFLDSKTLITAGTDCTISTWTVSPGAKTIDLQPRATLFGHRKPVTVLAASKAFSTFLSAGSDGKVFLWDLNRLEYIREVDNGNRPVECARVNNVNGQIMLGCGRRVRLFTLNGHLLLDQDVCAKGEDDEVVSCAFYEGVGNEWLERELVFTGHRRGRVNIWSKIVDPASGKWTLELVRRLDHVDSGREDKQNFAAAITCILPMAQVVYTGDEDGRVSEWDCLQRHSH
ncbi:beach-domain-containing protein [Patellaria atrata CBS 101060]|uniref:Beach-domain-containing protein n=1 Tax=Patellaria atrata CBS 101060 TaxID=1346257 RepID=A0A9P4VRP2_9PEZI|nr:beach-domain-containing protein [Patellaria atrata CBS 101060]